MIDATFSRIQRFMRSAVRQLCRAVDNAVPAVVDPLESRQLMATFYVSPFGSDANPGTSTSAAYKTIGKVNGLNLNPGDKVFFQGGQEFSGNIQLGSDDNGLSTNPITIGSYGSGRATLRSASSGSQGINMYNTQGIQIQDLRLIGPGGDGVSGNGINVMTASGKRDFIRVNNVEVSGFKNGVQVNADGWGNGFRDVRITNVYAHHNVFSGIDVTGDHNLSAPFAHENVYIGYSETSYNEGKGGTSTPAGSGIVLSDVKNVLVEYVTAHNNGRRNTNAGGPVGIWAWHADSVTFQYNVSHSNKTSGAHDGGGFDFDRGVSNSVMQHNLSYNNDGAGYLALQYSGSKPWQNNVFRYNISYNDGRRGGGHGAIHFQNGLKDVSFYNNTVITNDNGTGVDVLRVTAGTTNTKIFNNVFVAGGGADLLNIAGGQSNMKLAGNLYYAMPGSSFIIRHNGTHSSLDGFRNATGYENVNGQNTGYQGDPGLNSLGLPNIDTVGERQSFTSYVPKSSSPVINRGVDGQALYGENTGGKDWFAKAAPIGAGYDIGAIEYGGTPTSPPPPPPTSPPPPPPSEPQSVQDFALPWISADVGNVALDGGGSVATSGSINISGSGADIWGTNDAFHFGYQVLNGDGSIIARVTGVENVDPWAKAGLMIRESLASNAKNAFMFVSAQNGTWMQQRTTTGDATTTTDAANLPAGPAWLKLTRTGSTLVGYQSTDGVNWSQVGSASINMSSAVLVGLAITSHKVDDRATAFMDNVSISTTGGTVSAPSAGLLARWRFNEAAGNTASDSTANPANVTLNRGASFKVGRAGNSIYLDGVDDVGVIGQPTKLKISGKITLGAWIKPERTDGLRSIITHGWDSAKKSVYLRINNGFYQVGVWNGGGADIVAQFKVPTGDLNTWVHVAGTFDGSKWRLYRNGQEVASTTSSVGAPVVNDNWLIGASKGTGLGEFFKGHIDDATIYNRALSGSEIKTLMV